jgi:hypothetical protein
MMRNEDNEEDPPPILEGRYRIRAITNGVVPGATTGMPIQLPQAYQLTLPALNAIRWVYITSSNNQIKTAAMQTWKTVRRHIRINVRKHLAKPRIVRLITEYEAHCLNNPAFVIPGVKSHRGKYNCTISSDHGGGKSNALWQILKR